MYYNTNNSYFRQLTKHELGTCIFPNLLHSLSLYTLSFGIQTLESLNLIIWPVKTRQSRISYVTSAWNGSGNETTYLWEAFPIKPRICTNSSGERRAFGEVSRQTARQDEAAEWNATGSRPSASASLPADSTRGKQYSEESSIIDILNLFAHKEGTRNAVRRAALCACCRNSPRGTLICTGNHPTPVRSANTSSARANLLIPHILNVKPISFYWYSSELTSWSVT